MEAEEAGDPGESPGPGRKRVSCRPWSLWIAGSGHMLVHSEGHGSLPWCLYVLVGISACELGRDPEDVI